MGLKEWVQLSSAMLAVSITVGSVVWQANKTYIETRYVGHDDMYPKYGIKIRYQECPVEALEK